MSNDNLPAVILEPRAVAVVPDSIINEYLESLGNNLTPYHRSQFIQIARAFNLNPFIREIYGIPYKDKFSIVIGYEVYLKRAERIGVLAGWRAWTEGSCTFETITKKVNKKDGTGTWDKTVKVARGDLKGCVEITRKDWTQPFYHEVYLEEYNQENEMWGEKPRTMIKKVSIAQGFRMAFPEELGGMPYTEEEISEETEPILLTGKPEVKPPQKKQQTPPSPAPETPPPATNGAKVVIPPATQKQCDHLLVALAEYCDGDQEEMEKVLYECSHYTDREGVVQSLDLASVNVQTSGKWVGGCIGNIEKYIAANPKAEGEPELFGE